MELKLPKLQPTELRTTRLLLRQWVPNDEPIFCQMGKDPEVMRYFPSLVSEESSLGTISRFRSDIEEYGWGLWAVEHQSEFIGFTGLSVPRFEARFMPAVEIGWRLKPSAWGNGFATEAADACLEFGFRTLGLEEIVSFTAESNLPSRRVMARIGMTHDPRDDFDHPSLPEDSPLRRHVLYRKPKP